MSRGQELTAFDATFAGPGDVRALCRSMEWGATPAGPVERWPPSLRTAVRMCLDASTPTAIWAVPGLTLIYNDGYAALLGSTKHPWALGRGAREVWAGAWPGIEADVDSVIGRGEAVARPEQRMSLARDGGAAGEAFFTCLLTPIREEDGRVVGASNVMVEITDRVRAFTQRTAALEAMIQSSHDAIFAKDLEGRILFANPTTIAFLGKQADQILGKIDTEFLDADQARQTMANDRRVMETGQAIEAEETLRSRDGTAHIWHSAKVPYRDGSGRVIGVFGIARDITDRKHHDEALRAALESAELERRRAAAVIEALPAGIAIADASGRIVETNAALARIWRCPGDERDIGRDPGSWKGRWADTGKPLAPGDWALARALGSGEVVTSDRVEIERLDGSGPATIINIAAPIRTSEGHTVGAVLAIIDVSAQRRAEEAVRASEAELREAERLAGLGSWKWIVGGPITWSEGLFLILGRDLGAGPPTLETLPQFYLPEGWSRLGPAITRAAETGEPYELELEMIRQDGTRFWTITRGEAVRGPTGAIGMLRGTSHDITERRRAEQERERLLAALSEADRRKNEFLGVLSHELRNPLAPIRNSLDLLQRAGTGGQRDHRALAVIDRQLNQLTRLVDDLLDVTRISRGKIRLQRTRVDLVALVRQTVDDHRSLLEGCTVAVQLPEARLWVVGDPTRLAQTIGNLLQNAAKFTPRGGRISIALTRAGPRAALEVTDTGLGIEAEMLPRLFEPFSQAEHSLARTGGGLGLGLALVKGLVEQHGGTVTASSDGPGTGARFTVDLPLDQGGAPASEVTPLPLANGKGRSVLLIEDNVDAADSLADLLGLDGYDVRVSYSAREGIAKAHAAPPDVLLCDIGLPEMDGYEVARAFRSDPALRDVFLVALTGYAGPEDQVRATEAGFQRHLPKPPDLKTLEKILETTRANPTGAAPRAPSAA